MNTYYDDPDNWSLNWFMLPYDINLESDYHETKCCRYEEFLNEPDEKERDFYNSL